MRMPFSVSERLPVAGLSCLLLAAALAGCASKNPLMDDEPVIAKGNPEKPAELQLKMSTVARSPTEVTPAAGTQIEKPGIVRRWLGFLSPYRVDIQQGNFVTKEMVDQLRESMGRPEGVTREQVRFVLGTPLLTDIFHANQWDYVFRLQKKNGEIIASHVTAFFKDGRLVRIDGGDLPTEQEYLAYISGSEPGAKSPDKK
jgi:outer membrane protein assembly factor BamE